MDVFEDIDGRKKAVWVEGFLGKGAILAAKGPHFLTRKILALPTRKFQLCTCTGDAQHVFVSPKPVSPLRSISEGKNVHPSEIRSPEMRRINHIPRETVRNRIVELNP